MIGLVTFICELENIFDLNIKIELVLFRKTAIYFFLSSDSYYDTGICCCWPKLLYHFDKDLSAFKKKKRKPVDDWEITCKWYIRLSFRKKTHLTEKNEWNIFFVKNSFQILTIFDIGVYRGVYVIYLCCFIGHNTKREFFALSRQNHNNFADT